MGIVTNLQGEKVQTTKNADGSSTRTVLSTGNAVTASHSGSKDASGANTVDAYNQSIGYSADGKTKSGITTSDEAENRNKSANNTLNGITTPSTNVENPLTEMSKRLSTLQADLVKARESEKAANEQAAGVDAASALKKVGSSEESGTTGNADLNAAAGAINGDNTTGNIQDPVIRALADKTIANVGIITNQMNTLSQYRQQFNEYTQQDIDSISRTAERSVQRQIEENQRTADAMRFAGVVGGRAQFAPVVEQSIIHEVIQDGLDRVEVINEKKNTAIREARKAEADFNIDAFEQQSNLAKEYNNEIESTISAMNAQVRQVEKDERDKIEFRNAQEERNSLVLAEQLVNATTAEIQAAAAANGISYGLLAKAVNDAKFTASDRDLSTRSKEENILSSQESRANEKVRLGLEQARFTREGLKDTTIKSDIPDDVEQGFRSVARLSKVDAEATWDDIKTFGLNDSVSLWLEGGRSKAQVKAIVSAHEQSQRTKDEDGAVKATETENVLGSFIDEWKPVDTRSTSSKQLDKFKGQTISSPETFFKKN